MFSKSDDRRMNDGSKKAILAGEMGHELRRPRVSDGAKISALIGSCKPLDQNSLYSYLLLCRHFADTCVVAEEGEEIVGFLSGYLPPDRDRVFFVWQVAVDPSMRGRGLGKLLLREILRRPAVRGCYYIETTIAPTNDASQRLFSSLARDLSAQCAVYPFFSEEDFGDENHEAEDLFRIGPLNLKR